MKRVLVLLAVAIFGIIGVAVGPASASHAQVRSNSTHDPKDPWRPCSNIGGNPPQLFGLYGTFVSHNGDLPACEQCRDRGDELALGGWSYYCIQRTTTSPIIAELWILHTGRVAVSAAGF